MLHYHDFRAAPLQVSIKQSKNIVKAVNCI